MSSGSIVLGRGLGAAENPPRFLIVALRYIGDVLLSTPLALSIKRHLPEARVDYLVFKGTEGVLGKNPHVTRVHTVESGLSGLRTFLHLWRRYDCAIGANPSDRTAIYCTGAGRHAVGFSCFTPQEWWKKAILDPCRQYDGRLHIVPRILTQLEPLGIPAISEVVMGFDASDTALAQSAIGEGHYVLLHPYTRKAYKYWPAASWAELAQLMEQSGLRPLFTHPAGAEDTEQWKHIQNASGGAAKSITRLLTLPQLAAGIKAAKGYVGVDTVVTHMAAALGSPTVALYGPTHGHDWGPWPNGWSTGTPYQPAGQVQRRGNIILLQQPWPCVPCGAEHCAISTRGKMECLEAITPDEVLAALRDL